MQNKFKAAAILLWVVNMVMIFINFLDVKKVYDEFKDVYGGYGGNEIKREYYLYLFLFLVVTVGSIIAIIGFTKMNMHQVQIGLWIYAIGIIINFIRSFSGIWGTYMEQTGFSLMLLAALLEVVAIVMLAIKAGTAISLDSYAKYTTPGNIYVIAFVLVIVGAEMVLAKYRYAGIGLTDIVSGKELFQAAIAAAMLYVTGFAFSEYVDIERMNREREMEELAAKHRAEREAREERYKKANEE